jgi:hypothetical protein
MKRFEVKQELAFAGGLLQEMVAHRSVGLLIASGKAANSRATVQKTLAVASLSLGAKARDTDSISFEGVNARSVRSAMKAICCNATLRQSAGNEEEEIKLDSPLHLELRVAVLRDFEQWNKAGLCDFEQVLPLSSLNSLSLTLTHSHSPCARQVATFKVERTSALSEFKATAAEAFGIPEARQRYWRCSMRPTRIRPRQPLSVQEEDRALEELLAGENSQTIKLFLEASSAPVEGELRPHVFPPHTRGDALIFFKYYDHEAEELRFVCPLVVKIADPIASVLPHLKQALGLKPKESLFLFEEITPFSIKRLDDINTTSFDTANLTNGDIICVQRPPPGLDAWLLAPEYYRLIRQ